MISFPRINRRKVYLGKPGEYTYRKYKREIAEDCAHRCVYCDCHCNLLGGHDLMELDHFRPKAEALFPELEDEPTNLVLSCRSCNGKKRDDWPAGKTKGKTHVGGYGYIDPFKVQRSLYFEVVSNGELRGKKAPAAYVIEHLSLNRPFAMAVRARRVLRVRLHQAIDSLASDLKALDGQPNRPGQLTQIASLLEQANRALCKLELEDAAPL